jgi:hypothetical protein
MPSIHANASALAAAILRSASYEKLARLREAMKTILLTPSSRDVVLTLLKSGDLDDLKFVLDRVAESEDRIDFWNHTELGRTLARRMKEIDGGVPNFLNEILNKEEFWEGIPAEERAEKSEDELLSLKNGDNRALHVRLAAYAIIGIAKEADQEHLMRLTTYNYGLIARTAAVRLVRLMEGKAITFLNSGIDNVIKSGKSSSLAEALRAAAHQGPATDGVFQFQPHPSDSANFAAERLSLSISRKVRFPALVLKYSSLRIASAFDR